MQKIEDWLKKYKKCEKYLSKQINERFNGNKSAYYRYLDALVAKCLKENCSITKADNLLTKEILEKAVLYKQPLFRQIVYAYLIGRSEK
jgi:hypothetical protein